MLVYQRVMSIWLVVLTILKNMSSSMGRLTSHILWNIKKCLKPAIFFFVVLACYPLRKTKNNDHQDKPTGGNTTGPAVKQFAQRPRNSCTCGKKVKNHMRQICQTRRASKGQYNILIQHDITIF